jgi:nucleotidyltransferase substrate binding protein (TIGR01987 family)
MLDFSPLKNALATLKVALTAREHDKENAFVQDSCIQRFEYSYEMAVKFIRRFMEETSDVPGEIDALSFPQLIRTACERGLLQAELKVWKEFRDARNATSHAYDQAKAEKVLAVLPAFLKEAQALLAEMEKRQGAA